MSVNPRRTYRGRVVDRVLAAPHTIPPTMTSTLRAPSASLLSAPRLGALLLLAAWVALGCGGESGGRSEDAVSDTEDVATDAPDTEDVRDADGQDVRQDGDGGWPDGGDAPDTDDELDTEGELADGAGDTDGERPNVPDWPAPDCRPNGDALPAAHSHASAATLPLLRVDGTDIVDPEGRRVALRGVNFGTWLLIESWMAGLGLLDESELIDALAAEAVRLGVDDLLAAARASNGLDFLVTSRGHRVLVHEWRQHMVARAPLERLPEVLALWEWFDGQPWVFEEESLWAWLERRFGPDRAEELRVLWGRTFITEVDFERAAALGFTAIRLPLWFANLESADDEGVRWRTEGWDRLGDALDWAREHGLYLVIDLHGAPGGQSAEWHQGLSNGGALFSDPACLARAENLWRALATFVGDDPHVAILDLINEPMGSPSASEWARVHQALYDAVREVDATHIVMAEDGYRGRRHVSGPAELGWDNAAFSVHVYPESGSPETYRAAIDRSMVEWGEVWDERFASPLLLGEFNAEMDVPEGVLGMDYALDVLNSRGVHWTIWTWKFWTPGSVWGVYTPAGEGTRIDLRDASFEQIRDALAGLDSDAFVADEAYAAVLRARAADPVLPLDLGPR